MHKCTKGASLWASPNIYLIYHLLLYSYASVPSIHQWSILPMTLSVLMALTMVIHCFTLYYMSPLLLTQELSSNPVTYLSMALYYWSVFGNCSLMVRANCTFFGCIPCITHQFLTGLFQNSLLVYFSSVYWFHPPLLIGLDLGKYC